MDDGTGLLIGEFVDLATLNSPSLPDVDANEPSRIYEYDRDDERFEQVTIYHSVDSIQQYFHTLGFDDDSGPTANGIRDFPTLANAHWFTDDQSFYSTGDDAIHFGDGGVDDGEDGDIIAHEYGHAIQHNQNAAWGGGEMGAMGEGFGDYLAASFYADAGDPAYQAAHAAAVGEWDATAYSSDNPPNLRRVDGNKVYPDDLVGQVHADGEIWSAALWDIRAELGGPVTDTLVLESHFGLPGGATMPDAAEQILIADQNINGGANEAAIRQAFEDRGILEPPPGTGVVTFDAEFYAETDTMTVAVVDANGIEPLEVTVEASSGDVETFSLASTGGSTYEGTIDNAPGAPAADGVLQVGLGDTITVTYVDPDDGSGNSITSQDEASISNYIEYPSTDTPLAINSNSTVESVINVPDSGQVNDVLVEVNISHPYTNDLEVFLTSPSGTVVELFTNVGGNGDNFVDTLLNDDADFPISTASAPFTGSFSPEGTLADFDVESINGDWTLSVTDSATGDDGTLNDWTLFIDVLPVGLGAVELDAGAYGLDDTVNVTVFDQNVTGPQTADLTSDSGDVETITLSDNGDGTFTGSIATAAGSATASDGVLQAGIRENILVTYFDADDGQGGSGDRTDSAFIENRIEYASGDIPKSITDNNTITSIIEITDEGTIFDLDLSLDISHTYVGDLDATLTSPAGTQIFLFQGVGSSGNNFTGTILDDEAPTSIGAGSAPFAGRFSPQEPLVEFDNQSITGIWTLAISDNAGGDQGTLNAWSLLIDVVPLVRDITLDGPAGPVAEGDSGSSDVAFQIELSAPATEVITVDYATTVAGYANPATPGVDFGEVSGTATFNPGDSSFTVNVPVNGEQYTEVDEQFGLELSNASANSNLVDSLFDVTIVDNDGFSFGVPVDFVTATSMIETGAIGFQDQAYSADLGMGWSDTVGFGIFETPLGNNLVNDRAVFRAATFSVDVPNDTYDVTIYYGPTRRVDPITISFEGGPDMIETLNLGPSITRTYQVPVSDGQLNIEMLGPPGLDRRFRLGGLEINPVSSKGAFDDGNGDPKGELRWSAPASKLVMSESLDRPTMEATTQDLSLSGSGVGIESGLRSFAEGDESVKESVVKDLDQVFEELEF